jgi:DNA-binding CsgD family transcriptional regulator
MFLSEHTVAAHLRSIFRKIGAATRSGATRYALENGLA